MDYENIRMLAQGAYSPEFYTAVAAGTAVATGLVGYVLGRAKASGRRLRMTELESTARTAEANARHAEADAKKAESTYKTEELKEANGAHQRKLEVMDKERTYKIQDEDRQRQYEREARESASQKEQQNYERIQKENEQKHEIRLAVARELVSIKPVLVAYLEKRPENGVKDPNISEERKEYRMELIDKVIERLQDYNDDEDYVVERIINHEYILNPTHLEDIDEAVDIKFPKKDQPADPMTQRLEKLLGIILEVDN